MKTRQLIFATLGFALSALPLSADVFVLKDGTRLEGRILSQNDESYTLEVQVTPTIKDERTVAKADVERVETVRADLKDFEKIEKLVPTPDLMSFEQYDERMAAVKDFLKAHPKSTKARQANEIYETLKAEADQVGAGGVKLDGKILTSDEHKTDAYDIDSRMHGAKIREAAQANPALATKMFMEFARDYEATTAYREALPVARQAMQAYLRQIESTLSTLPARVKEQREGLARMSGEDRANTERAIREQYATLDARFAREKAAGREAWISIHPLHEESLREAARNIEQELRRLNATPSTLDGGEAYRETMAAIRAGEDKEVINTAFTRVTQAKVPERYIQYLKDAVAAGPVDSGAATPDDAEVAGPADEDAP
jgi:hypothetical protein